MIDDRPCALAFYRYRITNCDTGQRLIKMDPYAKQATQSVDMGVVRESDLPWTDGEFRMPDFNSLVVYELHLSSLTMTPATSPGS